MCTTSTTLAAERRSTHRGRILKTGKLIHDGHRIDCIIRDISPLGARVRLGDSLQLPTELELLVVSDVELHPAKLLWKSQKDYGLVFTGSSRKARSIKI